MKAIIGAALAAWVATLGTGCSDARQSEPIAGTPRLTEKDLRGQVVFMRFCNECHPQGEAGIGPAVNDKPAPAFAIKTQVRVGLGAMPAFDEATISGDQLDDLVSYMIQIRNNAGED